MRGDDNRMVLPKVSYLVCASQRSGTELLCRGLAATGVAGCPQEYFLAEDPAKLPGWRFWEEGPFAGGEDVTDRESYLAVVYRLGSTANGVFGAKIHWNNLRWALAKFSEMPRFASLDRAGILHRAFPGLRVIDVTRRDRVRDGEAGWRRLYAELGLTPCQVVYEDLASPEGYEPTIRAVLAHLGLDDYTRPIPAPQTRRQSNDLNEAWVATYLADRKARQSNWLPGLRNRSARRCFLSGSGDDRGQLRL